VQDEGKVRSVLDRRFHELLFAFYGSCSGQDSAKVSTAGMLTNISNIYRTY